MVTITNGTQVLTVTKGAYKSMYAPQGWEKIRSDEMASKNDDFSDGLKNRVIMSPEPETTKIEKKNDTLNDEPEYDADDNVDLAEIPISEMSVPQLKAYAAQLGIKVNTDSARQLRTQIRKTLEG